MVQLSDQQRQQIETAIFAGNKIEAIKLYREGTGVGLAEAKQAVEKMESDLRKAKPEKFTTPAGKKGCFGLVLAMVAMVILAAIMKWISS